MRGLIWAILFLILFSITMTLYIKYKYSNENELQYVVNSNLHNFFPTNILNNNKYDIVFKTWNYNDFDFTKNKQIIYYLTWNSLDWIWNTGWTWNYNEIQKIRNRLNLVCVQYNKSQTVPICIKNK